MWIWLSMIGAPGKNISDPPNPLAETVQTRISGFIGGVARLRPANVVMRAALPAQSTEARRHDLFLFSLSSVSNSTQVVYTLKV